VLEVVSDRKLGQLLYTYSAVASGTHVYNAQSNEYIYVGTGGNFNQSGSTTEVNYDSYKPEVMSYSDYYPFLMKMPGRYDNASGYRYQGQGQEEDNEFTEGRLVFEYRVHDPRIGRFLSVDPLRQQYAYNSTYAFAENRVIDGIDLEGKEYSTTRSGEQLLVSETTQAANICDDRIISERTAVKMQAPPTETIGPKYPRGFEQFSYNLDNSGPLLPGWDIGKKLNKGEEITTGDIIWEVVGIAPIGKAFKIASRIAKPFVKQAIKGGGNFVRKNMKDLTQPWKRYQNQINGVAANLEYRVYKNGKEINFDGFKDGTFLEAKGTGVYNIMKNHPERLKATLAQAQKQSEYVAGAGGKLEWHFAEKEAADLFKTELKKARIEGIEIIHTPMDWSIK
jgi:RHS repeat-associated protein